MKNVQKKGPAQAQKEAVDALTALDGTLDTLHQQLTDLRQLRVDVGVGVQQREERLSTILNQPPNMPNAVGGAAHVLGRR